MVLTLGLLSGMSSCSNDDTVAPPVVNVPQNTLAFKAFDTEAKTVTIESNADWTFEVTGDSQICDVTREEGSNTLTVTPKINYDKAAYTARIVITAGTGSNTASQTITVTQEANTETYLNILNSDLMGDNPIVTISNDPDGGNTEYEIRLATNNKLTLTYSQDQTAPSTTALTPDKQTRVTIDGCDWITYEVGEEMTDEGTVTVLTLSCTFNEDTSESRTAFLEIVSGEGTNNTVIRKRIGITQMADKPTIIINAPEEGLVATYDQSKPLTFSVAGNVEFTWNWITAASWVTLKETTEEGNKSNVRNFSLTFDNWTGLSDREATLTFHAVDNPSEAMADVKITQTAAPQASISLNTNSVVFNNGEETETKYVTVECSFSNMTITTKDLETETEAAWLTADYDASAKAVSVKVNGTTQKTRTAEVKLSCGGNGNEASATLTVTQLGTEATLLLDPESIQIDSKGTAQTIAVLTNQTDWEVVDPTAMEEFTITVDKEKKTITVSGTPLDAGLREHTYTVKAGELEKQFTVKQQVAYKVGDPYIVNGKTVGIIYQVDESGMNGKAFSLTVYNTNDKQTYTTGFYDMSNLPGSRNSGKENLEKMKTIAGADWKTTCEVAGWTQQLAERDGVDWYVPAIEELIELTEYMTGVKFQTKTYTLENPEEGGYPATTTVTGIPFSTTLEIKESGFGDTTIASETFVEEENINAAKTNWNIIRELYKYYTEGDQYIVFLHSNGEELIDGRSDVWDASGDALSDRWLSSTVESMYGSMAVVKTVNFTTSRVEESYANASSSWWDEYGGSIHPICQFGPDQQR